MLTVRREQIRAFERGLLTTFEDRLVEHVQRFFPRFCSALGDELRSAIRESAGRARSYGIESERDVCKYLNLVFTFGRNFDESPMFGWASEILRMSLPGTPKMTRLYEAARAHEPQGRGYFAPVREPV